FIFPMQQGTTESLANPVAVALDRVPARAELPPVVLRRRPRQWNVVLTAIGLVLAIGSALAALAVVRYATRGATALGTTARPSIAVLAFRNMSHRPEADWMSTAMAEMLRAELASGQQIHVIPSENIARMNLGFSFPAADTYGRDTLNQLHERLGSD